LAAARQWGVLLGALIALAIAWRLSTWIGARTSRQALIVGAVWIALTLAFEVGLALALGLGWDRVLSDYDPRRGGLMPLGLLALGVAPWIALRLRR